MNTYSNCGGRRELEGFCGELYDSTRIQGGMHFNRNEERVGLYYAGKGTAKHIIGLGKYNACLLETYRDLERAFQFISEKRPSFCIIEGAGNDDLGKLLAAIRESCPEDPSHIAIVEEQPLGTVEELRKRFSSLYFYRARSIGSDTIDAGLPSYLVERA